MKLSTIGQIAVPVKDVERATAFYRDALGLPFLFKAPPGLAFFDADGVRLMLSLPEGDAGTGSSTLYFTVEDIRAASAELKSRGVRFIDEPHLIAEMDTYDLWMTFFKDPEGNTHALMSDVPRR